MATTTNFPWESIQVPNDDFWKSFSYPAARNFLQCYSPQELDHMAFDASLSETEKIQSLLTELRETLALRNAAAAPETFMETDLRGWQQLMLGMATMEKLLGHVDEEEKIFRSMVDNSLPGNMSALHNLSSVMLAQGRYKEAEVMAREALPWLENHELLGKDSPQVFKCLRILTEAIWKQERYSEAEKLIEEASDRLRTMGAGKFAKYQAEESGSLETMVKELGEWKIAHEASK